MMDLIEKFLRVIGECEKHNVEYVLIGGLAVVIHGFPRLTQDIDIFVRPGEENIRKLQAALKSVFQDDSVDEITSAELKKYSVIRYGTPDGFSIDIIGQLGTAFRYEDVKYRVVSVEGCNVRVADEESLIRMKEGTMREIDQGDVRFLREKLKQRNSRAG